MENRSKAQTFLGFAIRAGKYRIGFNSVASLKRVYLFVVCATASENAIKDAQKLSKKYSCPLLQTVEKLENIIYKRNVKIIAVTDKNLADAVIKNTEKDFIMLQG